MYAHTLMYFLNNALKKLKDSIILKIQKYVGYTAVIYNS